MIQMYTAVTDASSDMTDSSVYVTIISHHYYSSWLGNYKLFITQIHADNENMPDHILIPLEIMNNTDYDWKSYCKAHYDLRLVDISCGVEGV